MQGDVIAILDKDAKTVADTVVSVYNPAIAVYIAKILATIRKAIKVAAAVLVPIVPKLVASF